MYESWQNQRSEAIGSHSLLLFRSGCEAQIVTALTETLPSHYVSNEQYANVLEKLGKYAAADYLRDKLPTKKVTRSGDLGEILALTYVEERTKWREIVKKLRWKDHRDMPMRGDDILAAYLANGVAFLLKGEAKSRETISQNVLHEAQQALRSNDGRPSPHALSFFASRLVEDGREELADVIFQMQYRDGIEQTDVSHMIFVLSGNDPESQLRKNLRKYVGGFEQVYVGVQVDEHGRFVDDVYEQVVEDGDT